MGTDDEEDCEMKEYYAPHKKQYWKLDLNVCKHVEGTLVYKMLNAYLAFSIFQRYPRSHYIYILFYRLC